MVERRSKTKPAKPKQPRRAASAGQATPNVHVPAAATAAVVTLAAPPAGRRNSVKYIAWSYSAAPTGGRLTVTDAGATVLDLDIPAAGPGDIALGDGLQTTNPAAAVVVTLASGGGAVQGKLNVGSLVE